MFAGERRGELSAPSRRPTPLRRGWLWYFGNVAVFFQVDPCIFGEIDNNQLWVSQRYRRRFSDWGVAASPQLSCGGAGQWLFSNRGNGRFVRRFHFGSFMGKQLAAQPTNLGDANEA